VLVKLKGKAYIIGWGWAGFHQNEWKIAITFAINISVFIYFKRM